MILTKIKLDMKVDVIIPFTMETQMHTAGLSWVSRFIARDVARIVSAVYAMVMREFIPCILHFCFYWKMNYEIDFSYHKVIFSLFCIKNKLSIMK